ncbi:MAG: DUF5005 domain-containing protein [Pirellulales bacterium]|nr:DUF5005 domain-containing protein [Pirellulales bacterium]
MRRLVRHTQVIALVFSALSVGAWAIEPLQQAEPDAAWDAAFDRSDGWIGGDAIYSTPLPNGNVLWLFADTYIGTVRERRRQAGVRIVNNTLGLQRRRAGSPADLPPRSEDLTFLWDSRGGAEQPQAWIRPPAQPAGNLSESAPWFWLADALVVPRPDRSGTARASEQPPARLLIFLWRMERTNAKVMNFRNAGCDLAIVDDPRADWTGWQPRQFSIVHGVAAATGDEPRRAEIVWGSEVLLDPESGDAPHVLIYGYRQQLRGSLELVLARAPADRVEQFDTWQFRTANSWTPNLSGAAALADGLTTEFSVSRVEHFGTTCYALVQCEPFLGDRILTRAATTPYGPWSQPHAVYRVPGLDRAKQHITYAAKAHPEVSRLRELLVSYVVNSLDFGESATNADIYRPRFVRVPLDLLPAAPTVTGDNARAK